MNSQNNEIDYRLLSFKTLQSDVLTRASFPSILSVEDVKESVASIYGLFMEDVHLLYGYRALQDHEVLSECLPTEATVTVVLRLHTGLR